MTEHTPHYDIHDAVNGIHDALHDIARARDALSRLADAFAVTGNIELSRTINLLAMSLSDARGAIHQATGDLIGDALKQSEQAFHNVAMAALSGIAIGARDKSTDAAAMP